MKQLLRRIVGWVVWRWTLPAKFRAAQVSMVEERLRWQTRCEKAEAAPNWKDEFERETARVLRMRRRLARAAEERKALEDGLTASGLSPAQVERLALLAMASGKLGAEAAKVIMNGWRSPSPGSGRPGYVEIERAMGRLQAVAELMAEAGDVRGGDVHEYGQRAKERLLDQVTRQ